jgi:hypothetical protein
MYVSFKFISAKFLKIGRQNIYHWYWTQMGGFLNRFLKQFKVIGQNHCIVYNLVEQEFKWTGL